MKLLPYEPRWRTMLAYDAWEDTLRVWPPVSGQELYIAVGNRSHWRIWLGRRHKFDRFLSRIARERGEAVSRLTGWKNAGCIGLDAQSVMLPFDTRNGRSMSARVC